MMFLGLRTGLRQGEILGLRWEDVDLVAGKLLVRQAIARGTVTTPKSLYRGSYRLHWACFVVLITQVGVCALLEICS